MGGVLKNLLLRPENGFVSKGIQSRVDNSFVKNIKGSTLGRTLSPQAEIPESACEINFNGDIIIQNNTNKTNIVEKMRYA